MSVLDDWDYDLPPEAIARWPAARRLDSRLLWLPLGGGGPVHRSFADVPELLRPGDLLVANDTRVMAARLRAHRRSGGPVEVLLLEPGGASVRAMLRPARRVKDGEALDLDGGGTIEVLGRDEADPSLFRVSLDRDPIEVMAEQGEIPLPPYLERDADATDRERYQTVYAGPLGAAAAPTAGLHFTPELLAALGDRGIGFATLTLHVGIGTFRPVRDEDLARGRLHAEPYTVPEAVRAAIAATRARGGRVIAVGTTTARALETATTDDSRVPEAGSGVTELLIAPPWRFRAIDGLITNFHLPRSSLLLLVGALVGRERLLAAYAEAVREGYRFYSYGDAMLLV